MDYQRLLFRVHAIQRMFERNIAHDNVVQIVRTGEVIEEYSEDKPFPSFLLLGWVNERPLHVVAAKAEDGTLFVITVYEPDPEQWDDHYRKRKF